MLSFKGMKEINESAGIAPTFFFLLISAISAFGDCNDVDSILILTNLEDKAKRSLETSHSDYTIEDIPLLINAIDIEYSDNAGLINEAIQEITGLKKPLDNEGYTDKAAWQQWWDSLHGHNRCVSRYFADWFFEHKDFNRALQYYEKSLTEKYEIDHPSIQSSNYEHAQYRIALIKENNNEKNLEPLRMYVDGLLTEGGRWKEKIDIMQAIKDLYPDSDILDDADYATWEAVWHAKGKAALVPFWKKFLSDYPDSPLYKKAQISLTRLYNSFGIDCQREGLDDEAEKWYRLFLAQPQLGCSMEYEFEYLPAAEFFEKRGQLYLAEIAYIMNVRSYTIWSGGNRLGAFYEKYYSLQKYIDFLKYNGFEVERMMNEYLDPKNSYRP